MRNPWRKYHLLCLASKLEQLMCLVSKYTSKYYRAVLLLFLLSCLNAKRKHTTWLHGRKAEFWGRMGAERHQVKLHKAIRRRNTNLTCLSCLSCVVFEEKPNPPSQLLKSTSHFFKRNHGKTDIRFAFFGPGCVQMDLLSITGYSHRNFGGWRNIP